MFRIYLAIVDIIPAAVVLLPLFGILFATVYDHNLRKSVLYLLFCLYLAAVYSLVGMPNVTYVRPEVNLNLIPFVGMASDLKNSILNVALFVPMGAFLPVLWHRFRKFKFCVAFGFGFSIIIELLQMLTFRATDVNDLITNVCGTALGFLFVNPLIRKYDAFGKGNKEPFILCVITFGIMFYIHPFLSQLIWDWIL